MKTVKVTLTGRTTGTETLTETTTGTETQGNTQRQRAERLRLTDARRLRGREGRRPPSSETESIREF